MEVAFFQEFLSQFNGGVISVGQEGILDDDTGGTTCFEVLDEVFQEEVRRFSGLDGEVLLDLFTLAATKRRICQDIVKLVLGLDIGKVLSQGIGLDDIRRLDPVEYHIHHCDKIRERLLFLAVEGGLLQFFLIGGRMDLGMHIVVRFAEEPGGTASTIINALSNLGIYDLDNGPDERAGRVVFTSVATGIAHLVQPALVQIGHFVLLLAGLELQAVYLLNDVPEAIAAHQFVAEFGENETDFDLDGGIIRFSLSQVLQIREEFAIHELYEVISYHSVMDVVFPGSGSRHSPGIPPVLFIQDWGIGPATQKSRHFVLFVQIIQVFQEEYPRGLLNIIQFAAASFIGTQSVVYIFKDLLKCHCVCFSANQTKLAIFCFGIMGKSYTFVKNIFRYEKNCHFTTAYRLCIR